jgi:hypothetical protein
MVRVFGLQNLQSRSAPSKTSPPAATTKSNCPPRTGENPADIPIADNIFACTLPADIMSLDK